MARRWWWWWGHTAGAVRHVPAVPLVVVHLLLVATSLLPVHPLLSLHHPVSPEVGSAKTFHYCNKHLNLVTLMTDKGEFETLSTGKSCSKTLQSQGLITHPSNGYSGTAGRSISLHYLRIQPAMFSWRKPSSFDTKPNTVNLICAKALQLSIPPACRYPCE